jgi:acyl-CoA synthetase (AMP-forming)/AMP-acid ligase II
MIVGSLAEIRGAIASDRWRGSISVDRGEETLNSNLVSAQEKLLRALDLRHGDRVVLTMDSSLATVAALVAAWGLGLVVVPVRGSAGDPGVQAIMADCGARAILDPSSGEAERSQQPRETTSRFRFRFDRAVSGSDLALIIYTSGSTGTPKGIVLTHANVVSAAHSIASYLGILATDTILCISPLSFDYGLYQLLFAFHCDCRTILFGRSFNPLSCIETVRRESVTILPVVPSMGISFARTLAALKRPLPSLRLISNTGGHLPDTTVAMMRDSLPDAGVCLMYGLSESKRALFLDPAEAAARPGSVGKAMPGLAAVVFTRTVRDGETFYEEAESGVVGELFVRGPSVMQGYCNGAGGGATLIAGDYRDDNWLATGDLFERDEDGYLYYRGRAKELIKQDGFCLYPREIEAVVERNPNVELAVVYGTTDAWGNEIACLAVQRSDRDCGKDALQAIKTWLETSLDPDYRPRLLRLVPAIPLSANGKPDRAAMRAEAEGDPGQAAA